MAPYHAGFIYPKQYLLLKQVEPTTFQWFKLNTPADLEATSCIEKTPSLAIQAAYENWEKAFFRLLHCGFRYSLPTRDEVGSNAFFWQMAKSYATSNGRYFDEEVGHHCYVDFASEEALSLWRSIR